MEFRLLGGVEALVDSRPFELGRRLERCLVGLLLLDLGNPVPVDRLAELLWEDDPPANPRAALRTFVSRLRSRLQHAGADRYGVRLRTAGGGYQVDAEPHTVDLHRFRLLVGQARDSADPAERSRLLGVALGLWRGTPLAGVASERLRERVATRFVELRTAALELRVDTELALGRHHELVPELTELHATYPSRERLLAALMLALYRDGRRADALDAYRQGARRLVEELGLDPPPELRRLHTAILRDDPALAAPAAPAVPAAPAGDGERAEALGRPPAQLPADVPDFVGRAGHLAELDRLAAGSGHGGTVLVVGPGGSGKTALAVHWGHRNLARFPDGQLYVDLHGHSPRPAVRADEVLGRFLRALGVRREDAPVDVDEQAALYRTLLADRRVLVVLDNAVDAEQVRPLLPGSPSCLALVTSRDRLGGLVAREGARRIALDTLCPDESLRLLAAVVGPQRTAREPDAVAELARLCGHLPLALRVAGANLVNHPGQTVAAYARQVGGRLDALRVDGDDRSAVVAAFDLSYLRLAEPHRRLFRLLGLAPGVDVTVAAATAMTGVDPAEAAAGLDQLAAAHLLVQHAPGRYVLHDLVRRYATDRAADEETPNGRRAAVRGLLDWYVDAARAAGQLLWPGTSLAPARADATARAAFGTATEALSWLDAERDNLAATVRHAVDNGFERSAWSLVDALRGYLYTHGSTVDWINLARSAVAAARAGGDPHGRVAAQLNLGHALVVGSQCDERQGPGWREEAVALLTDALAVSERIDWRAATARVLNNLGLVLEETGLLGRAEDHCRRAVELCRELGVNESRGRNNLAVVLHSLGRLTEAAEQARTALDLADERTEPYQAAAALDTLALLEADLGRVDDALTYVRRALAIVERLGDLRGQAIDRSTLGGVLRRLGRYGQSAEEYRRALDLARQTGDRYAEVVATVGLAATLACADPQQAAAWADRGACLAAGRGYRVLEGQALGVAAGALLAVGRREEAARLCERALALHRSTGHRLGEARTLLTAGRIAEAGAPGGSGGLGGSGGSGADCWRQALAIFTAAGAAPDAEQARALLAAAPDPAPAPAAGSVAPAARHRSC